MADGVTLTIKITLPADRSCGPDEVALLFVMEALQPPSPAGNEVFVDAERVLKAACGLFGVKI